MPGYRKRRNMRPQNPPPYFSQYHHYSPTNFAPWPMATHPMFYGQVNTGMGILPPPTPPGIAMLYAQQFSLMTHQHLSLQLLCSLSQGVSQQSSQQLTTASFNQPDLALQSGRSAHISEASTALLTVKPVDQSAAAVSSQCDIESYLPTTSLQQPDVAVTSVEGTHDISEPSTAILTTAEPIGQSAEAITPQCGMESVTESVDDEKKCVICLLPDAEDPRKCDTCIALCCYVCIDEWLKKAGKCPMCRTEWDLLDVPERFL